MWHHQYERYEPMEIDVPLDRNQTTTAIIYPVASPPRQPATLILAHGAGAGQKHPFMVGFARGLSERGLDVLTFDFLYMHQRRRMPDRMPQLVACYEAVIASTLKHLESARQRLFIGGKSMGGRVATHVGTSTALQTQIKGIVLLGYPLHPPGRLDQLRDAHLPDVKPPMLFVQGSRDTFGTSSELAPVIERLSPSPSLYVVEGGDHSFKVASKGAPKKQAAGLGDIQDVVAEWIQRRA
jgi:predicted alpha/beta-hydrolase family hydrolase